MKEIKDRLNPVQYSLQECQFLIDHLGEPSYQALQSIHPATLPHPNEKERNPIYYPEGVIPASVKPILDRVYELIDLERRGVLQWVGLEKVKSCLQVYLDQQQKWMADKAKFGRAPRFPSMSSYDGKNRPHKGGPGSDSGTVSTYFDREGNRIPFALDLLDAMETGGWVPEWATKPEPEKAAPMFSKTVTKGIVDDADNHRLECPVCKHTESYKVDSRSSFNAARGRMSKHLRNEPKEVDLHRELYTNEFGE